MDTNLDKKKLYENIGMRIRTIRKLQKITMKEVGQRVGVSESMIHRYETGDVRSFSIDMLKNIATVLNVNPAMLLGWSNDTRPIELYCTIRCSEPEKKMIQKYRQLTLEGKETVDTILDLQYKSVCKSKKSSPKDEVG